MVKRKRLVDKPEQPQQPSADAWISAGGRDPEAIVAVPEEDSQQPQVEPAAPPARPQTAPEGGDGGKSKYPHRISFDVDNAQYKRLKWASFDSDRSMNEILRSAAAAWLEENGY